MFKKLMNIYIYPSNLSITDAFNESGKYGVSVCNCEYNFKEIGSP